VSFAREKQLLRKIEVTREANNASAFAHYDFEGQQHPRAIRISQQGIGCHSRQQTTSRATESIGQ